MVEKKKIKTKREIKKRYRTELKKLKEKQKKEREKLNKNKKRDIILNRAIKLLEKNIENTPYPINDLFFMYGVEYGKTIVDDKVNEKEIVKIEVEKFFNKIDKEIKDKEDCKEKMSEGIAYSGLVEISDGSFIVKPIHYITNFIISFSPILIAFKNVSVAISMIGLFLSMISIIVVFTNNRIIRIHTKWGEKIYFSGILVLIFIFIFDIIQLAL